VPFDETVTNIEDRVWAEKMLQQGYRLVYEPAASVYHYHGIHQDGDAERCVNVVRILESLKAKKAVREKHINLEKMNIVAIIPVKGSIDYLDGKPLAAYTIERALESKYIKKVIVSTDNPELAKLSKELGADVPFLRDRSLSKDFIDVERVLQHSLEKIEQLRIFPDLIVYLEITFPFRPIHLIDDMIQQLVDKGFDSVLAAKEESRSIWKENIGKIERIDEGHVPRKYKQPCFVGIKGLCCVAHPEFIRQGVLLGEKIGIYEVNNPYSHLEVRTKDDFKMAALLVKEWFK